MTSRSGTISVGWPIPTGLTVVKKKSGAAAHTAIYTWNEITPLEVSNLDPSGGGFNTIYWRVSIEGQTYLCLNPIFEMGVPLIGDCDGRKNTCVKVQTIYDLSDNPTNYAPNTDLATSDWCPEVCVENDPDLYCQSVNKNKKNEKYYAKQNYGSMNMRYSRAVRMGRFGSSRGAAAYSFYK
jgi:hypothetical protein